MALGATNIEKHFNVNLTDGGKHGTFPMETAEITHLVVVTEIACQAIGKVRCAVTEAEKNLSSSVGCSVRKRIAKLAM